MANSRVNRYALADYEIAITFPNSLSYGTGTTATSFVEKSGVENDKPIVIGGPGENGIDGSYTGSITVKRNKELWTTEGDATGSWVHNKNLDRTGTISVDITQVSDQIVTLTYLCSAYESVQDSIGGLEIEIKNIATNETVASGIDCYITKIPDHNFKETADRFTFEFTCGRVMFY